MKWPETEQMPAPLARFVLDNCLSGAFFRWCGFSVFSFLFVTGLTALLHDGLAIEARLSFLVPLTLVFFLNFITIRYFVYDNPTGPITQQFLRYSASAIVFRITEFVAYCLLTEVLSLFYLIAVLIVLPTSFFLKFIVFRYLVFEKAKRPAQGSVLSPEELSRVAQS